MYEKIKSLETERLILTPWEDNEENIKGLFAWASRPDVGPHAGWAPHASLDESAKILREMLIPSKVAFAIRDKKTNIIIGNITLYEDGAREGVNSLEMGYALSDEYWGKGLMTEAGKAVMDYGFKEFNLACMSIKTSNVNERSQGVIKKLGFTYEGTLRKAYHIYNGTDRDSRIYSILREEWEKHI